MRLDSRWSILKLSSFHLLQDVQDADVVDGDKRFEVRRDADALQVVSCGVEGLQGFSSVHAPPLLKRKRNNKPLITKKKKNCRGQDETLRYIFTFVHFCPKGNRI